MKKSLFLLFVCFAIFSFGDFREIEISSQKKDLSLEIYKIIKKNHYKKNDRGFENSKFIESLVNNIDKKKIYFTEKEFEIFKNKSFEKNNFDIEQAYKIINAYYYRVVELTNYQIELIKNHEFDFKKNDVMDVFDEDNIWANSYSKLKERWFFITKNDLLVYLLSEENSNYKENLVKRYKNRIRRINQQKEEDLFTIVINTLANEFDPHTSYLSPRSAEDFDLNMSLKLEGIGALLGVDDDYTKIISLVPGGPAEKSSRISPEDKITKIKESDSADFVDVIGWRIDEVVDLIRGPSGTNLQIEFLSFDSDYTDKKIISLTRDEINLEQRAAKSKIVESKNNTIGIIELPAFYIDFNALQNGDDNYRSSSKDVKEILSSFNNKGVDIAILDLRNNGGGALIEANNIIGLFIPSGPTVLVKGKRGFVRPYGIYANQHKYIWKKPLIVLVNRYSASASEIVAGAIQDYKRGLVVGHRTFGKGTVQKLDNLSTGQIKITESKYFRISGSSMQNKGVFPDIVLPSTWDIESVGESSYPTSLEWEKIRPYNFKEFDLDKQIIESLKENHLSRSISDANLIYMNEIKKNYDINKNKKFTSLNIEKRKNEKDLRESFFLNIENKRREKLGIEIYESYKELNKSQNLDSDSDEINIEKDFILAETIKISEDYIEKY